MAQTGDKTVPKSDINKIGGIVELLITFYKSKNKRQSN